MKKFFVPVIGSFICFMASNVLGFFTMIFYKICLNAAEPYPLGMAQTFPFAFIVFLIWLCSMVVYYCFMIKRKGEKTGSIVKMGLAVGIIGVLTVYQILPTRRNNDVDNGEKPHMGDYLAVAWDAAGIYVSALDLSPVFIGEKMLEEEGRGEEAGYIFSEEGQKRNWGITIDTKEGYEQKCEMRGWGIKEMEGFDYDGYFVVCTFGRKLATVRAMYGLFEFDGEPYLELEEEYEEGMVYYYSVPYKYVNFPYECQADPGGYGKSWVHGTDYEMLKENRDLQPMLIQSSGPFKRWSWAYRCAMEIYGE